MKRDAVRLNNADVSVRSCGGELSVPYGVSLEFLQEITNGGRSAVVCELDYQMTVEVNRWKGERREMVEKSLRRVLARVLAGPCANGIVV